jgi:hypothetical protein
VGGAMFTEKWLQQWYPDKILDTNKHTVAKGLEPVEMNAIGGLRLALSKELA